MPTVEINTDLYLALREAGCDDDSAWKASLVKSGETDRHLEQISKNADRHNMLAAVILVLMLCVLAFGLTS